MRVATGDGGPALRAARAAGRHLCRPAVHHDRAARPRPPVTYTTFQARDLGGDTAELFKTAARDAYERFQPQAMMVGASCTAELIQDDPGGLARALGLPIPVVPLELPAYQKKENWGAAETFYQLVRALAGPTPRRRHQARGARPGAPRCNILGPTALGFRHRDDVTEITGLLGRLGIDVDVVAPHGRHAADLARLGEADFNVVLYPGDRRQAAPGWSAPSASPATTTMPIGVGATRDFVAEVAALAGIDRGAGAGRRASRAALVFALGRLDLPDRQARLHLRRRDPCGRRRAHRSRGARLHGRRPRHL